MFWKVKFKKKKPADNKNIMKNYPAFGLFILILYIQVNNF